MKDKNKENRDTRVTFREFWALCLIQYRLALPGLIIMILSLLSVYFIVKFCFH